MDSTLDHRIARVIERRQEQMSSGGAEHHPELSRRLAHAKLVSELPRLVARISTAVAEMNDRISDAHIWIKLDIGERSPAAEAIYTLSIIGANQDGPVLILSVDNAGKLTGLLCGNQSRRLVKSSKIFATDHAQLLDVMVDLLEAHYG